MAAKKQARFLESLANRLEVDIEDLEIISESEPVAGFIWVEVSTPNGTFEFLA